MAWISSRSLWAIIMAGPLLPQRSLRTGLATVEKLSRLPLATTGPLVLGMLLAPRRLNMSSQSEVSTSKLLFFNQIFLTNVSFL